ncbi:carotenoid 1,2-hydratase [Limibacillus halophilus]
MLSQSGLAGQSAVGAEGPMEGPLFDRPVAPGGYAWWYLDGISDDGRHAITVIAFVGSVFSPYYAWAGRKAPLQHCALNVALYSPGANRWAMTERTGSALRRDASSYELGESRMDWDGGCLSLAIHERAFPRMAPLRGRLRLMPEALNAHSFPIDSAGKHLWRPIAPRARIEVEMERAALSWRGRAYIDSNWGDCPLEESFRRWDWARLAGDREDCVLYDTWEENGASQSLSLAFLPGGAMERREPPPRRALPASAWRLERGTRSEGSARLLRKLEDAPFYSRSVVEVELSGSRMTGVHESLALRRFAHPLVKLMLPFRMPRAGFFWRA